MMSNEFLKAKIHWAVAELHSFIRGHHVALLQSLWDIEADMLYGMYNNFSIHDHSNSMTIFSIVRLPPKHKVSPRVHRSCKGGGYECMEVLCKCWSYCPKIVCQQDGGDIPVSLLARFSHASFIELQCWNFLLNWHKFYAPPTCPFWEVPL